MDSACISFDGVNRVSMLLPIHEDETSETEPAAAGTHTHTHTGLRFQAWIRTAPESVESDDDSIILDACPPIPVATTVHNWDCEADALAKDTDPIPHTHTSHTPVCGTHTHTHTWDATHARAWSAHTNTRICDDGISEAALHWPQAAPASTVPPETSAGVGGLVASHPCVCVGYTLVVEDGGSDVTVCYPTAWTMQYSPDGVQWYAADMVEGAEFVPGGGKYRSITRVLSCPCVAMGVRIKIHRIRGSTGSMTGSTTGGATLRLTGLRLWERLPDALAVRRPPDQGTPLFPWRVMFSGPAGQRRLRIAHLWRSVDIVSAGAWADALWAHVAVFIATHSAPPSALPPTVLLRQEITIHVRVNGMGVEMLSLREAYMQTSETPVKRVTDVLTNIDRGFKAALMALHRGTSTAPESAVISLGAPIKQTSHLPARSGAVYGLASFAEDAAHFPNSRAIGVLGDMHAATIHLQRGFRSLKSDSGDLSPCCLPSHVARSEISEPRRQLCKPIASIEHLMLWRPNGAADACLRGSVPFACPAARAAKRELGCNRHTPNSGPLMLVCHDCGPTVYKQDADIRGCVHVPVVQVPGCSLPPSQQCMQTSRIPDDEIPIATFHDVVDVKKSVLGHGYNFRWWHAVDIFVYFSHNRITIPPKGWIDEAHIHDVRILGTIIAEWSDGHAANEMLLRRNADGGFLAADRLAALAEYYGFDGWLLNIEAPVEKALAALLPEFVAALTRAMHDKVAWSIVLWYDSIDPASGRIRWQSQLNAVNDVFLRACDGVFLDYHWAPAMLNDSLTHVVRAGFTQRVHDVFAGIDVWGRGTFGGGGLNTSDAVNAIMSATYRRQAAEAGVDGTREVGPLSVAVFGPAWAYEHGAGVHDRSAFLVADDALWRGRVRADALPALTMVRTHPASGATSVIADGWFVTEVGGDGWEVVDIAACDSPSGRPEQGLTSSYSWCKAEMLLAIQHGDRARGCVLAVSDWVHGTGPNPGDPFRWAVALLAADMAVLDEFQYDTGDQLATAAWQKLSTTFANVPGRAAFVRVQRAAKDAEHWAGHFGARMCGLSARWEVTQALPEQMEAGIIPTLARKPRAGITQLPFSTTFSDGCGAISRDAASGTVTALPWFNLTLATRLPDAASVRSLPTFHCVPCPLLRGSAAAGAAPNFHDACVPLLVVRSRLSHTVSYEGGSAWMIDFSSAHAPAGGEGQVVAVLAITLFDINLAVGTEAQGRVSTSISWRCALADSHPDCQVRLLPLLLRDAEPLRCQTVAANEVPLSICTPSWQTSAAEFEIAPTDLAAGWAGVAVVVSMPRAGTDSTPSSHGRRSAPLIHGTLLLGAASLSDLMPAPE